MIDNGRIGCGAYMCIDGWKADCGGGVGGLKGGSRVGSVGTLRNGGGRDVVFVCSI